MEDANFLDMLERPIALSLRGGDCQQELGRAAWRVQGVMCPRFREMQYGRHCDDAFTTETDQRLILPAMDYYITLGGVESTPLSVAAIMDYFAQRYIIKRRADIGTELETRVHPPPQGC